MKTALVLENKIEKLILAIPNKSKAIMLKSILLNGKNTKVNSLALATRWSLDTILSNKIKSLKK